MGFLSLFPTSFVDSDADSEPTSPASPLFSSSSSSSSSPGRLPPLSLYTVPPSYPSSAASMSIWYLLDSPPGSSSGSSPSSPPRSPLEQHGVPVVARHTHGLGPCLSSLRPDHAYILDQGHEVFVWLGQASPPAIRTEVSQLADRVAAGRRVLRVRQGREPFVFLVKFADGLKAVARQRALCATPHGLQRNKEEGGQVRRSRKNRGGDAYDAMLVSALAAMQEARRQLAQQQQQAGGGGQQQQQQHQRARTLTASTMASAAATSGTLQQQEAEGGGVLACWVLEEGGGAALTRLGPDESVHLYSHCSYLLLHVPSPDQDGEGVEPRAFFWQGLRAPVSDGVRWELHVRKSHLGGPEWQQLLGGPDRHVPIQRVRQGQEPAAFHALVAPRCFIFHDRVWRRRGEQGTRTCLYQVHATPPTTALLAQQQQQQGGGAGGVTVSQVDCSVRSLHTRDAFICLRVVPASASSSSSSSVSSSAVWFWVGKEADPGTQEAGAAAAFELMEYYALSSEEVEVALIEEQELGSEPPNPEVEHRWVGGTAIGRQAWHGGGAGGGGNRHALVLVVLVVVQVVEPAGSPGRRVPAPRGCPCSLRARQRGRLPTTALPARHDAGRPAHLHGAGRVQPAAPARGGLRLRRARHAARHLPLGSDT